MRKRITYKRVWMLAVVFFGSLLLVPLGSISADWEQEDSWRYDEDIGAGDYFSLKLSIPRTGYKWEIEFEVLSGNDINFYLVDEMNFWKFKADESFSVFAMEQKSRTGHTELIITDKLVDENVYAVFSNQYSLITSKRVVIDITRYIWMDPPSLAFDAYFNPNGNVGDSIQLEIAIHNEGDLSAENVGVILGLSSGLSASQTTKNLGSILGNDYQSAFFTINCNDPGSHSVRVQVTANNAQTRSTTLYITVTAPDTQQRVTTIFDSPPPSDNGGFIPGFGTLVTLAALPIGIWLRKRIKT